VIRAALFLPRLAFAVGAVVVIVCAAPLLFWLRDEGP